MNLDKKTGINIGDFATGIVLYRHLHEETQKDIDKELFNPESHTGPVVEIEESIDNGIDVKIEKEENGYTYKYVYHFDHIFEVECICGNQKLFHSTKEKWVCPWCEI